MTVCSDALAAVVASFRTTADTGMVSSPQSIAVSAYGEAFHKTVAGAVFANRFTTIVSGTNPSLAAPWTAIQNARGNGEHIIVSTGWLADASPPAFVMSWTGGSQGHGRLAAVTIPTAAASPRQTATKVDSGNCVWGAQPLEGSILVMHWAGYNTGGRMENAVSGWTYLGIAVTTDSDNAAVAMYVRCAGASETLTAKASLVSDDMVSVSEWPITTPPAFGLDVYRIIPPGDTIEYLATLDDAFGASIRPVRNQPGSGQFSINRYSPNATAAILAPGNLVKVRIPEIDSGYIFAWFMDRGNFNLVSPDEQGGEAITIGGDGALAYWDRAIWLASKFVVPWWPGTMDTPPGGTRGAVIVTAGTYRRYTIAGGVITGYTTFTTSGFSAYFDTRQTYQWPAAGSKRFLVHLTTTEDPASPSHVGEYIHPHQDGATEYLPSYAIGSSVLLSAISADKPGVVLRRLYTEGTHASRPTKPIPLMTIDFSDSLDSAAAAWATTAALAGVTAALGETYLATIIKLLGTGVIDVEMTPDLLMQAWNSRGRNLTGTTFGAGKVRFVKGVNIADELRRERDDLPVATFIEVVGTDNIVGQASLADAASRVARETSATADSADPAVLTAGGLANLNARLVASDAIGFRVITGNNDATGLYLPGPQGSDNGDYWLGDTVTVHTGTGEQDFNQASLRVSAITIAEDDAGNLDVTPEVGSVLGEAERRLYGGTTLGQVGGQASFSTRSQFTDTEVAESAHPDLATHDGLGLATQAELDAHTADATDAHDASAISILDTGAFYTGTDVEAALAEIGAGGIGGGGSATLTGCMVSGTSTALTNDAYTPLALGSADEFDSDGYHDPASNNTRLTIPAGRAGKYLLTIQSQWPNSGGGSSSDRRLAWSKNGGTEVLLDRQLTATATGTNDYMSTADVLDLAVGDYIEVEQWVNIASQTATAYKARLIRLGGLGQGLVDYGFVKRSSGDLTLNNTAWTNVDTGIDIVLTAVAGDVIEVAGSFAWDAGSPNVCLDVATIVSGSPVNYVGATGGGSDLGIAGWIGIAAVSYASGASVMYTLVSGDISAGTVTLRLRYRTTSAANRILRSSTTIPLHWSAKNLGPAL